MCGVCVEYAPDCGIAVVNPAVLLVDKKIKRRCFFVLNGGQTVNSSDLNGATVSGQRLYKVRWRKGRKYDAGRCRGVVYLVYPVRLQASRPASEYAQPPRLSLQFVDLRHDHVDSKRDKKNNLVISRREIALKSMPTVETDDAVETTLIISRLRDHPALALCLLLPQQHRLLPTHSAATSCCSPSSLTPERTLPG